MIDPKNKENIPIPPKDEEELALEKLVFGDLEGFEANLKKIDNLYDFEDDSDVEEEIESGDSDAEDYSKLNDDQLFFVDEGENADDTMDVDESSEEESNEESDDAWNDSDDDKINISLIASHRTKKLRTSESEAYVSGKSYVTRLRSQFEKIYPKPGWVATLAEEPASDASDVEDELENNTNSLLKVLSTTAAYNDTGAKLTKLLAPNKIDIVRLKDANQSHPSRAAIQTISFHPSHPLMLTGGYDRTLRIYHIDGKVNNVVTTLHLRDAPVQTAQFHPNGGTKIFSGGRRKYLHKWDLESGAVEKISRMYGHENTQRSMEYFKISPKHGKYIALTGNSGWCNILSGSTGQWINGFKIEGNLVDIAFSADESSIFVVSHTGEIWQWDIENNKIASKWTDETGVGITKIQVGGKGDRWVAVGSNSGIVTVYDRTKGVKKPIGVIENLTTTISSLEFSPDGQVLCIASRSKKDALKLVHLPSCTVFSNWPTMATPLGKVTAIAFSNGGEMLCIGNEAGKARLYKLNHY
ncbi:hypothetical protein BABINDRAFT_160148 [Babjeviella inositovora NRRL Y-12698]|uniref:Uncharacterized protein n=1 Tax=Babjeviella inositovora NRRL Y-12698 TaxID=984486 RepID=A0A1E3QWP5_9ASCO|nr:uncharacterized protein BABINDRAFT_160148 [Babjeviella inositovora NRRL Y-12698]ODQ81924.1 hypothetical protein BABINDRAFT_160148 [Babjeviella inositovora NRRL Y-12698]